MILYFLVEGNVTEKEVYKSWLGSSFSQLRQVHTINDLADGTFRIVSGGGYPAIKKMMRATIADLNDRPIDRLFICLDAEEYSAEQRRREIEDELRLIRPRISCTVIVQNCCMETWFLGNRVFVPSNPTGRLRDFKAAFDVRRDDPERMQNLGLENQVFVTKAQFHKAYFKSAALESSQSRITYDGSLPTAVLETGYFSQLVRRTAETDHLQSFRHLVDQWRELGGHFPELERSRSSD